MGRVQGGGGVPQLLSGVFSETFQIFGALGSVDGRAISNSDESEACFAVFVSLGMIDSHRCFPLLCCNFS